MVVFSSAVSNMLSRIGQQIEQRKLQNCATNGRSNNTNRSSRYPPTEFFNMRMQLVLIFAGVLLGTYTYCLLLERMGMRSVMQESEDVEMILLIHGGSGDSEGNENPLACKSGNEVGLFCGKGFLFGFCPEPRRDELTTLSIGF